MGRIKEPQGKRTVVRKRVLYRRLRERMHAYDVDGSEMAHRCCISRSTFNNKINGRNAWNSDEMWCIMRYLDIPEDELYLYFPPNGEDIDDRRQTAADAYLRTTCKSAVSDSSLYALKELVDRMVDEAM